MRRLFQRITLRHWFQRVVLRRAWLAFIVLGLSFFAFGIGSLNLVKMMSANANYLLENGWTALWDGGLAQLGELLLNGYVAMVGYVIFKSCEHALVDWMAHDAHPPE